MKTSIPFSRRMALTLPLLLGAWTLGLHAQSGSLDTGFKAGVTLGQVGFSVAVQSDGKVIAAGTFGVIRFLPDGAVDPLFQSIPPTPALYGGNGTGIGAVALQSDGRILVTGTYTNPAGASLPGVFRLNPDGRIDPTFNADPSFPGGRVLLLQPDGKVVIDGLIRLLADGSSDPGFASGVIAGDLLALAPDGRIYFVSPRPSGPPWEIGRVNADGSRDESFRVELGSYPPGALAVQRDGKLIVGGYSDGPGPEYKAVRRLLPDGSDDPDWSIPLVEGGDAVVYALLVQPDGKVLVGGNNLMGFNGVYNANLGRLNPDGSVDTTFDTQGDLHYYDVADMALAPDGKVIAAGYQVNRPDITVAAGIWRLTNDTGLQPQLDVRFSRNEGITLRLSGQVGATYRLEYREQLPAVGAWTPLTNLTLLGDSATWQDTGATNSKTRFYRAASVQ